MDMEKEIKDVLDGVVWALNQEPKADCNNPEAYMWGICEGALSIAKNKLECMLELINNHKED